MIAYLQSCENALDVAKKRNLKNLSGYADGLAQRDVNMENAYARAIGNLFWLCEPFSTRSALVLTTHLDTGGVALTERFQVIKASDVVNQLRMGSDLALQPLANSVELFDAVLLGFANDDQLPRWGLSTTQIGALLAAVKSVMAQGGLLIYVERVGGLLGEALHILTGTTLSRQVRAVGFSRSQTWYVLGWPTSCVALIPAASRTVGEWEHARRSTGARAFARRWLARAGLHGLLYDYRLTVVRP